MYLQDAFSPAASPGVLPRNRAWIETGTMAAIGGIKIETGTVIETGIGVLDGAAATEIAITRPAEQGTVTVK